MARRRKTANTGEAMSLFEQLRTDRVKNGKEVAVELCKARGRTNSKEVVDEMLKRGLIPRPSEDDKLHWIGHVFARDERFVKTNKYVSYRNDRVHERTIPYWELAA